MLVDVSIVTSGHDVADARIHRLCAAFAEAGLIVELLGLGDPAGAPPGVPTQVSRRGALARRALLAARYARRARGRIFVALDPDSLVACLVLGRIRGRAVVADIHEDYASLLSDRAWARGPAGWVGRALVAGATWAAGRASLVIVADSHVPPLQARRRVVLRNLPYLGMLPEPTLPDGDPRAIYVGDVRSSRGLWAMVAAVEAATAWSLDIVGPVAGADSARLDQYLAGGPARDRIRSHGRLPPREAWLRAEGAWCGLVLLEDTTAFRAAMPSKLYEYAACGLPVIVTDLPRQREFVRSHGLGEVVPAGRAAGPAAAVVLSHWLDEPGTMASFRARAIAWRGEAQSWAEAYAEAATAIRSL